MFTQFDKTLATVIMAVLTLATALFGHDYTIYATQITTILVALMPVVVYFVPNLSKLEDGSVGTPTISNPAAPPTNVKP